MDTLHEDSTSCSHTCPTTNQIAARDSAHTGCGVSEGEPVGANQVAEKSRDQHMTSAEEDCGNSRVTSSVVTDTFQGMLKNEVPFSGLFSRGVYFTNFTK